MISQLIFLFYSTINYQFEKKFLKEKEYSFYLKLFYLLSSIILIFFVFINIFGGLNDECKYNIYDFGGLNGDDIDIKIKSISVFPETSNILCLGKIQTDILSDKDGVYSFEIITSKFFINFINIFYGLIFGLSVLNLKSTKKQNTVIFLIYLFIDYLINIFFFQLSINFLFLLSKVFFLSIFYHLLVNKISFYVNFKILPLFGILFISVQPLNMNFHPDQLYYLGYSLSEQGPNSAFFGNEQLYIYSYIIKILFSIFGIYSIVVIKILLSLWLSYLVLLYSDFFKFDSKLSLLLTILLVTFQSFAGGDQFWGSFVPKNFCYLFIFTGIYSLLKKRHTSSILFFSAAAYFQLAAFIVWLPVVAILHLYNLSLRKVILSSLTVLFITTPILYSLFIENFNSSISTEQRTNSLKFIISEYLQVHTYPFIFNNGQFTRINPNWIDGFRNIGIFLLVVLLISIFLKSTNTPVLKVLQFSTFQLLLCITFNFFFPLNILNLLNLYKIISLLAILLSLYLVLFLNSSYVNMRFVYIIVIINFFSFGNLIDEFSNYKLNSSPTFSTTTEFKEELNNNNIETLILPLYNQGSVQSPFLDIEPFTQIDTYVAYKYFPTTLKDTSEWTIRIKNLRSFYEGNCRGLSNLGEFHYLSYEDIGCGTLIFESKNFMIYKYNN